MDQDKLLLRKVSGIENRLQNVENALDEFRVQILENSNKIEEGLHERLSDLQDEIQRNSLNMKKMQAKLSNRLFSPKNFYILIFILILWTIFMYMFHWVSTLAIASPRK